MDINPAPIESLKQLFNRDKKFRVPKYQRNYAWNKAEHEDLLEDIINSFTNGNPYFMGTLVLNRENRDTDILDIIDGQQRLATFCILVSVCKDILSYYLEQPTDEIFNGITKTDESKRDALNGIASALNLLSPEVSDTTEFRILELNQKDDVFFAEILTCSKPLLRNDLTIKSNDRLTKKCQKRFIQWIIEVVLPKPDGISVVLGVLKHVSKKMCFLPIIVGGDENAYLLFESLNSKGLDLSVADLLKNKIMMLCNTDQRKKERILQKWYDITSSIDSEKSRFTAVDFIRFYWIAFHEKTTTKELYRAVKNRLTPQNVEEEVGKFSELAAEFSRITSKDFLYPSTNISNESDKALAELNTLKYKICYPTLLWLIKNRPDRILDFASLSMNFLFRTITIGGYAVRNAEKAFDEVLQNLKNGPDDLNVFEPLKQIHVNDQEFINLIKNERIDSNDTLKYIWARVYEENHGRALTPNFRELHLEHILPVKYEKNWNDFDAGEEKEKEDWVYNCGNTAILEKGLNQTISNKAFGDKIEYYKKRETGTEGTSIPETYKIHEECQAGQIEWTKEKIQERAEYVAGVAVGIWSIDH